MKKIKILTIIMVLLLATTIGLVACKKDDGDKKEEIKATSMAFGSQYTGSGTKTDPYKASFAERLGTTLTFTPSNTTNKSAKIVYYSDSGFSQVNANPKISGSAGGGQVSILMKDEAVLGETYYYAVEALDGGGAVVYAQVTQAEYIDDTFNTFNKGPEGWTGGTHAVGDSAIPQDSTELETGYDGVYRSLRIAPNATAIKPEYTLPSKDNLYVSFMARLDSIEPTDSDNMKVELTVDGVTKTVIESVTLKGVKNVAGNIGNSAADLLARPSVEGDGWEFFSVNVEQYFPTYKGKTAQIKVTNLSTTKSIKIDNVKTDKTEFAPKWTSDVYDNQFGSNTEDWVKTYLNGNKQGYEQDSNGHGQIVADTSNGGAIMHNTNSQTVKAYTLPNTDTIKVRFTLGADRWKAKNPEGTEGGEIEVGDTDTPVFFRNAEARMSILIDGVYKVLWDWASPNGVQTVDVDLVELFSGTSIKGKNALVSFETRDNGLSTANGVGQWCTLKQFVTYDGEAKQATIKGVVKDQNNALISDVTVSVGSLSTKTNAKGEFTIADYEIVTKDTIKFFKPRYEDTSKEITKSDVDENSEIIVNVTMTLTDEILPGGVTMANIKASPLVASDRKEFYENDGSDKDLQNNQLFTYASANLPTRYVNGVEVSRQGGKKVVGQGFVFHGESFPTLSGAEGDRHPGALADGLVNSYLYQRRTITQDTKFVVVNAGKFGHNSLGRVYLRVVDLSLGEQDAGYGESIDLARGPIGINDDKTESTGVLVASGETNFSVIGDLSAYIGKEVAIWFGVGNALETVVSSVVFSDHNDISNLLSANRLSKLQANTETRFTEGKVDENGNYIGEPAFGDSERDYRNIFNHESDDSNWKYMAYNLGGTRQGWWRYDDNGPGLQLGGRYYYPDNGVASDGDIGLNDGGIDSSIYQRRTITADTKMLSIRGGRWFDHAEDVTMYVRVFNLTDSVDMVDCPIKTEIFDGEYVEYENSLPEGEVSQVGEGAILASTNSVYSVDLSAYIDKDVVVLIGIGQGVGGFFSAIDYSQDGYRFGL